MNPGFEKLYDEFNEGRTERRGFFKKLILLAGSIAAGNSILPLFENTYASASIVPENHPDLNISRVSFEGVNGQMKGYMAVHRNNSLKAGVVVIHENRGLNPHIEDVARRIALEGFVALAPDALSTLGGTPSDPDQAVNMIQKLDSSENLQNFVAAARFLKTHPDVKKKVGCMGFCWGGGLANQLAVHSPDITAAVPYYGMQPTSQDVPKIKAALLLHYAGEDQRINAGIEAYEKALKSAGVEYRIHIYPGAQHAFNNDTNVSRYDKPSAELAWARTIDFLKQKL